MAERLLDDQPVPARASDGAARRPSRRAARTRSAARRSSRARLPVVPRSASTSASVAVSSSSAASSSAASSMQVAHPAGELVPDLLPERVARVALDGAPHRLAEARRRCHSVRGDADDREPLGQQAPEGERVERRHQLALGQVARGAEDDERARRRAAGAAAAPRAADSARRSAALIRADLHGVAAELVAQRRVDLGGERLVLAGGEAGEERRRDHRHRHVLGDRLGDRPAALARVLDVALDLLELPALELEGGDGAARAATSARPSRSARCPAISCRSRSNSERLEHLEALGVGLHQAVLDPVVDHLHEVAGARGRRRARSRRPARGCGRSARAG